jgi:Cytochrome c554 and c-prime
VLRVACLLLFVFSANVFAKDVKQTREDSAQFVGAIGCRSSSCHGGAGEKRSQYISWSQKDFHTKAFAILSDARSARIAETIGGGEATASARCTVCHSPFHSLAPTRLALGVKPDEGVSCETCHGAASPWLRGHTRPDWTYAMRVSAGMRDLKSLYVRANACVACHQNIDSDILKAGHPPLVFELDSQSVNEPKHWRDEDPMIGPRSWLTGQAVALRETCWHARTAPEPSADSQETAMALAWLLAKVTALDSSLPKIVEPSLSDLEPLQKQADDLARRAANWNPSADSMMSILRGLSETAPQFTFHQTKRLVLALDRLANALKIDNQELIALREDVRTESNINAARFAEHLRAFRAKL